MQSKDEVMIDVLYHIDNDVDKMHLVKKFISNEIGM